MSKLIFKDVDGMKLPLQYDTNVMVVKSNLEYCDYCHDNVAQFDGATKHGPWAFMCTLCFNLHGRGLGLGRGQMFIYTEDAR